MEILGRECETEMDNSRMKGQHSKIVENEVNNGNYAKKKIMKLNTEITLTSKEKEARNNKDETRIIIMKNRMTSDANFKIHRMDHNFKRDTPMTIQDIFTIIGEFKTHIRRLKISRNSRIIQD